MLGYNTWLYKGVRGLNKRHPDPADRLSVHGVLLRGSVFIQARFLGNTERPVLAGAHARYFANTE